MSFFVALAIVKGNQRVFLKQLAQKIEVFLHQSAIQMQHVQSCLFGDQKLEHLGAGALHYLRLAPFGHVETSKGVFGTGVSVAAEEFNGLLSHPCAAADGSGTVSDIRSYLCNEFWSLSVGGEEKAQGTAESDAAGIAPLQVGIEQPGSNQRQQFLFKHWLEMSTIIQQLLSKGLAEC